MQECKDALGGHRRICGPTHKKIRSMLCAREYKTKKQGKIQRAPLASRLFSAMPPLEAVKVLVSIMMSVSLSNKGKPLKLRHYDISRAYFQGTAQRLIYIKLPADVQRGAVHRTGPGVRRWSGSLVKAQASARLDVPTALHHFFYSADLEVQRVCTFFSRRLGCVLDGQPTVVLRVSAMRR